MRNLFTVSINLISSVSMAQQSTFKGAFLEKWNNSRDYLVAVAVAMPSASYDFKPTERQKSFKEQLLHIQRNINWLHQSYFSTAPINTEPEDYNSFDKKEIIELLQHTFKDAYQSVQATPEDDLIETVKFFAG
jgi:hypothetical protein